MYEVKVLSSRTTNTAWKLRIFTPVIDRQPGCVVEGVKSSSENYQPGSLYASARIFPFFFRLGESEVFCRLLVMQCVDTPAVPVPPSTSHHRKSTRLPFFR